MDIFDGPPTGLPTRLFVREYLSKPENRANLFLTAATGIDAFWEKLSEELEVAPECHLAPTFWSQGGRPDLTVFQDGSALRSSEVRTGDRTRPRDLSVAQGPKPSFLRARGARA